jgi:hypothetical protein
VTVEQAVIATSRGDRITVTLMDFPGQPPTMLLTVDDVDDTVVPTATLTASESAELREAIRSLWERAARRQVIGR